MTARDTRVLCASPGYRAAHGTPDSPEALTTHNLFGFRVHAARPLIGPEGAAGRFDPGQAGCRLVVDDRLSQKIATMAGAGISINSVWSVHGEFASGVLVRCCPDTKWTIGR